MTNTKKHRKLNALDVYVIFSISALVIYTIVSQVLAVVSGLSLDTLTTCFFGFFGGEIVTCALIKIFKLKNEGTEITVNAQAQSQEGGAVG